MISPLRPGTVAAHCVHLTADEPALLADRGLGVALCVLFLLWFPSGIGMMYKRSGLSDPRAEARGDS